MQSIESSPSGPIFTYSSVSIPPVGSPPLSSSPVAGGGLRILPRRPSPLQQVGTRKRRIWENDFELIKHLSDTESSLSESEHGFFTLDDDENWDESMEPSGGCFAFFHTNPRNQELLEPYLDLTEEEQVILLRQKKSTPNDHSKNGKGKRKLTSGYGNYYYCHHSSTEAFEGLRTRSQRTLKKHRESSLLQCLDSVVSSFALGSGFYKKWQQDNKGWNGNASNDRNDTPWLLSSFADEFEALLTASPDATLESTLKSLLLQISLVSTLHQTDFADEDDDNEDDNAHFTTTSSSSSANTTLRDCLLFDFDDTFRRHLIHAICEFYSLTSYSYTCHHDHTASGSSQSCKYKKYCTRPANSATHRITLVHNNSNNNKASGDSAPMASSSSSSSSSSYSLSNSILQSPMFPRPSSSSASSSPVSLPSISLSEYFRLS